MSLLADPPRRDVETDTNPTPPPPAAEEDPAPLPVSRRRVIVLVVAWLAVTVIGVALVLTNLGPMLEARDQRALLVDHRREIRQKSQEAFGLQGIQEETSAPAPGDAVAIVDIPGASLRQVVVEGATPRQTRRGPGHVIGTAGPGQPGNSVVVGRARLFGGPFADLDDLSEGDEIVVTTTQGQSLYVVEHVGSHRVREAAPDSAVAEVPSTNQSADEQAAAEDAPQDLLPEGTVTTDELFGPSDDDRLTLVTSAGSGPWSSDQAMVVVATLEGQPFPPTPQGGRTEGDDGRSSDPDVAAPLFLALLGYGLAVATAVWAYRRLSWRAAYLISVPILVALTVVLAEQISRTLPAWA